MQAHLLGRLLLPCFVTEGSATHNRAPKRSQFHAVLNNDSRPPFASNRCLRGAKPIVDSHYDHIQVGRPRIGRTMHFVIFIS